jgi:hypothetical protein
VIGESSGGGRRRAAEGTGLRVQGRGARGARMEREEDEGEVVLGQ